MANNISVKDANATSVTIATTESDGVHTPKHIVSGSLPAGTNTIGNVGITPPDTVYANVVEVSGTAAALASTTELQSGVTVKNPTGNSVAVAVGPATVTPTAGFLLAVGEEIFIPINDLAEVYCVVSAGTSTVTYIGS